MCMSLYSVEPVVKPVIQSLNALFDVAFPKVAITNFSLLTKPVCFTGCFETVEIFPNISISFRNIYIFDVAPFVKVKGS
jgi:hypothetical protein